MIIESRLEKFLRTNYNRFMKRYMPDDRHALYNIEQTCPELLQFNQNYETIRAELESFLQQRSNAIPRYNKLDINIPTTDEEDRDWRVIMLHAMGAWHKKNTNLFPETTEILKTIPNLFQAFFSVLDENVSIPAHEGSLYSFLRYHMGVIIPSDYPPEFKITDSHQVSTHQWQEGSSILFDDSLLHEVNNHSAQRRVILIVDILRPVPMIPHLVTKVGAVATRYFYGNKILRD